MNNLIHIENRQGKLKLNDTVHKDSADKLIEELETLYGQTAVAANMQIGEVVCSADDALESIEVEINSPGGSVMEGSRIYNALRDASARGVQVTTLVNGMAASMGSVILMAGDSRKMTHGSRIMIHEASTMAYGDAKTLRKSADLLEGISAEIAGIYADRTGGDAEEIRNLMLDETWMDTEQAKSNGFIHTIIKDGKEIDPFDIRDESHTNSPMSILSKLFPDKTEDLQIEAAVSEIESLRTDLESSTLSIEDFKNQMKEKDEDLADKVSIIANLESDIAESVITAANSDETIITLEAELTASKEDNVTISESVGKQVAEALAGIGQSKPLDIESNSGSGIDESHEVTRDEFNAMSPRARSEFSVNGGKIK